MSDKNSSKKSMLSGLFGRVDVNPDDVKLDREAGVLDKPTPADTHLIPESRIHESGAAVRAREGRTGHVAVDDVILEKARAYIPSSDAHAAKFGAGTLPQDVDVQPKAAPVESRFGAGILPEEKSTGTKLKENASYAMERTGEKLGQAKDATIEKSKDLKEKAGQKFGEAKEAVKETGADLASDFARTADKFEDQPGRVVDQGPDELRAGPNKYSDAEKPHLDKTLPFADDAPQERVYEPTYTHLEQTKAKYDNLPTTGAVVGAHDKSMGVDPIYKTDLVDTGPTGATGVYTGPATTTTGVTGPAASSGAYGTTTGVTGPAASTGAYGSTAQQPFRSDVAGVVDTHATDTTNLYGNQVSGSLAEARDPIFDKSNQYSSMTGPLIDKGPHTVGGSYNLGGDKFGDAKKEIERNQAYAKLDADRGLDNAGMNIPKEVPVKTGLGTSPTPPLPHPISEVNRWDNEGGHIPEVPVPHTDQSESKKSASPVKSGITGFFSKLLPGKQSHTPICCDSCGNALSQNVLDQVASQLSLKKRDMKDQETITKPLPTTADAHTQGVL